MPTKEQKAEYWRKWSAANKEKVRDYKLRYRLANRDALVAKKRVKNAEASAKKKEAKLRWQAANPETYRVQLVRRALKSRVAVLSQQLRRHYQITVEDYRAVFAVQGGVCAICGATQRVGRTKRLHVDHDHATGRLRALLCAKCNSAIGYFDDNPHLLRRAAAYVELFGRETIETDWLSGIRRVLGALPEARRETRGSQSVDEDCPIRGDGGADQRCARVASEAGQLAQGRLPIRA